MSRDFQENPGRRSGAGRRYQFILVAVVVALFVVILGVKLNGTSNGAASGSPTAIRGDAVAGFEQAQASGRPVFVLFHSLTCDPCVEISANVDRILPAYEGKGVPLLLIGLAAGSLRTMRSFSRLTPAFTKLGGVTLVGVAAYLTWTA